MADGMLCIDFGSAYTKVSLRRGRRKNSEMIVSPQHTTDDLKICVPSAVVVDTSNSTPRYTFGIQTEARRSGGAITVRRNWKNELFCPTTSEPAPQQPRRMTRLEQFLHSPAFCKLANENQINEADIQSLQQLVIRATSLTLPIYPTKSRTNTPDVIQQIASEYFAWLRRIVLEACASLSPGLENAEDYPIRVAVPAFAPEGDLAKHPGCVRLATALRRANWKLHPERPFISEPYANSIGVLTQGSNCTRFREMFRNGLLITTLADPKTHPEYRVVVMDVGAFTTDFAALTLRTEGRIITLDEIEFDTQTTSIPLGISHLDERVVACLAPDNHKYMRDEAPATEWQRFRHAVYLLGEPYKSPSVGVIAGSEEGAKIKEEVQAFQQELGDAANSFFASFTDVPFKEAVMTGGGCTIPWIQEALLSAAQRERSQFRKVHLPAAPKNVPQWEGNPTQLVTLLEGRLPRGATALGGTSAYFDMVS